MKPDKNIYADMGRRIRERRKKLGLTQVQLCGDYMTRNMLSRIETGDAHPSLETLLFISQKLKTPPSFFLCRDLKEEAEYTKAIKIKDARRFLGTGQYKKCIDICSELPSDDDEVSAMEANAHIMAAIALFDSEHLSEAEQHLACAVTSLHSTVYLYSEMLSQIKLLRMLSDALAHGIPPRPEELPSSVPVFFSKDRYLYILALSMAYHGDDGAVCIKNAMSQSSYKAHIEGIELIANGEYLKACTVLETAMNDSPDCYCSYFILLDLERAFRLSDDYKSAYSLAEKRMQLHDKYSNKDIQEKTAKS